MADDGNDAARPCVHGQSEIEAILFDAYRCMSPAEKWRKVSELNRALEMLALADVRRMHPDADEQECRLRAASRRVPADLMRKAFGWDIAERGF